MIHMVDYNEIVKKSNFRKDTRAEHELGIFMDENYYSRLCEDKAPYLTFERETDLKLQYEGIDVIIDQMIIVKLSLMKNPHYIISIIIYRLLLLN